MESVYSASFSAAVGFRPPIHWQRTRATSAAIASACEWYVLATPRQFDFDRARFWPSIWSQLGDLFQAAVVGTVLAWWVWPGMPADWYRANDPGRAVAASLVYVLALGTASVWVGLFWAVIRFKRPWPGHHGIKS